MSEPKPCKTCICLAICVAKYNGYASTLHAVLDAMDDCSIYKEYMRANIPYYINEEPDAKLPL